MAITDSPIKLTYEDYLHFPEDGRRHELIEGDHHVTPAPNAKHQSVVANLQRRLGTFVHENELGWFVGAPFDVILSEIDVVQPDLLFVAREHLDRRTETHLRGAPDLAVEIVSESTRRRDEITKRHLYERHGVAEYWIVDPVIDAVKIYRLGSDGRYSRVGELTLEAEDVLESPLFPGFLLSLEDLFA
jgi:Uma2 family endonuclease